MYNDYDELILKYDKYIRSIVRRFKVTSFDEDDLYQAGCLGLYKAIKNYDNTKDTLLTTYAFKYILGEISKEYAKLNLYGKKKYNEIRNYILKNANKTTEEIINDLKISKDTYFQALSMIDKTIYLSDDLIDLVKDNTANVYLNLDESDYELFNLYVKYKLSQQEIAKLKNVSQSTISRKLHKILSKIRKVN